VVSIAPRPTSLEAAITASIDTVNANPKPFVWTKSADDILASIKRVCLATLKTAEIQPKSLKLRNRDISRKIGHTRRWQQAICDEPEASIVGPLEPQHRTIDGLCMPGPR
jgi:hypothetical protein